MLFIILRTFIVYLTVVAFMRIMGKRQVGELQPSEFCITILISELAAIPVGDPERPIIAGLAPIAILVVCEITLSCLSLKFPKIRRIASGQPAIVIAKGKVDEIALRKLRMSVDDLVEGLRQNGVFSLGEVSYAVMETNGKLSVLLKDAYTPVNKSDLKLKCKDAGVPIAVISDGKLQKTVIKQNGIRMSDVKKELKRQNLDASEVFIMTVDNLDHFETVRKRGAK